MTKKKTIHELSDYYFKKMEKEKSESGTVPDWWEGITTLSKNAIIEIQKELDNIKQYDDAEGQAKSGMYGEMPMIKIGEYTISEMSDKEDEESVWIQHESGEGGQFRKDKLEEVLSKFYSDFF